MGRYRHFFLLYAILLGIVLSPGLVRGHEVVGEVTPLMMHTNHTLTFIKRGRITQAIQMTKKVFEDFRVPTRDGKEEGLKTTSKRVDRAFGTKTQKMITTSIEQKDLKELKEGLELLSFLLMLEKFDVLQSTFGKPNVNENAQKTIFWLGRNYFSYLLEPTMGEQDPIEEKRLDRLLDQMLYSLQDGEWERFIRLREGLTGSIIRFFDLPMPKFPVEAPQK